MHARYPKEGILRHRVASATIDYSFINDGYIIAWVNDLNPIKKFKINIAANGKNQNFSAHPMHDQMYVPMVYGSGRYIISVFRNIQGSRYEQVLSFVQDVQLTDELSPWLYPTIYSEFFPDSKCVREADRICKDVTNDFWKTKHILDYILKNITYDTELAKTVSNETRFWIPDPEDVIRLGKSICWGFSSLFAAMLRSQGIPCKIAVGYAGSVYHAWNEVYLKNGGTLTVRFHLKPNTWNMIDSTFAQTANQVDAQLSFEAEGNTYIVDYYG